MGHERTGPGVDPAARFRWDAPVPKYDAFGREIGEDTLSGLGGEGAGAAPTPEWTEAQVAEAAAFGSAAPEARAAAPDAPAAPQPAPRPAPSVPRFEMPATGAPVVHVRRRSGLGCFVGLVILLVVVAIPILAVVSLVGSAGDAIDDITGVIDSAPDPAVPEAQEPAAKPPSGITGSSMVAQANFGKALRRLDRAGLGSPTFIRLSPDRVDAQLSKGSRQRSAQVDFEGDLTRSPASPGSNLDAIAFSQIDRAAPARLVRGSAARYGVREKGINYLVLMPYPGEGHRWIAYFKNGTYVQGDRHGKVVRKIS
jgi:hypothetical protein